MQFQHQQEQHQVATSFELPLWFKKWHLSWQGQNCGWNPLLVLGCTPDTQFVHKKSIAFLLEELFRCNKSALFWDIIEWDFFSYTSCYHVRELLPNCLSPLLSFYLVSMPPCFFEVSGFIIPNSTYDLTHHTLHVEIPKYIFSDCKWVSCLSSCSSRHKLLPYFNAMHLPFQMLTYVFGRRNVLFNFVLCIFDVISNLYRQYQHQQEQHQVETLFELPVQF